jgi:hypothetical protein
MATSRELEDDGSNGSFPTTDSRLPTPGPPPTPDSQLPTPGSLPTPDLREVAAAAWDRVRFLEECSRRERREMGEIIRRESKKARDLVEALLGVFRGYKKILFEARHYEAKLQEALFRFLSQLYGEDPGFEPPNPVWTDPKLYHQAMKDMQVVWGN